MSRRRRSGQRPRRLLTPALRFRVSEMHMLCHRKTSPRSQAGRFNHVVDLAWLERARVRPDAEAALLVYPLDPCRQRRTLGEVMVVLHRSGNACCMERVCCEVLSCGVDDLLKKNK